ncbi:MAG TPA: type II secretion system protein GspK [Terriglobia bacterium]|nr:type II secretion system protein GspK [Terriglobia bacterium]
MTELKDATVERLKKTRITFADKKPAGVKYPMLIKTLAISAGMLALVLLPALAQEAPNTLPEDEYTPLFENVCGSCHAIDLVISEQRDHEGWFYTVDRMSQDTSASEEELDQIVAYLDKYFGLPVNVNTASAEEIQTLGLTEDQAQAVVAARDKGKFPDFAALSALPALKEVKLDGVKSRMVFPKPLPQDPTRQTYLNICSACHGADIVVGETHNRETWGALVGRMREHGANGSDDDFTKITDYLVTYFGPKSGTPEAAATPASVQSAPAPTQ